MARPSLTIRGSVGSMAGVSGAAVELTTLMVTCSLTTMERTPGAPQAASARATRTAAGAQNETPMVVTIRRRSAGWRPGRDPGFEAGRLRCGERRAGRAIRRPRSTGLLL